MKWVFLGTVLTAGHALLTPSRHHPTFFLTYPTPIYGLKMNSGVHAIIAAIRILLHTKVSILTLVLSLTYIVKSR